MNEPIQKPVKIRHRCDKWRDIDLGAGKPGGPNWLFGTVLQYEEVGFKKDDGSYGPPFWMMLDEKSETFSVWRYLDCPFCGAILKDLLGEPEKGK